MPKIKSLLNMNPTVYFFFIKKNRKNFLKQTKSICKDALLE